MLPWSPPSTMTKVTRWTLETTVFFVGWKVEGKLCWKSVLLFFSNTLCLQVESHSLCSFCRWKFRCQSYLWQVCIFYERAEPWHPSIGKSRGFLVSMKNRCCITWRNDVGCLVNPRRIIAYFFGLLLSLDFAMGEISAICVFFLFQAAESRNMKLFVKFI